MKIKFLQFFFLLFLVHLFALNINAEIHYWWNGCVSNICTLRECWPGIVDDCPQSASDYCPVNVNVGQPCVVTNTPGPTATNTPTPTPTNTPTPTFTPTPTHTPTPTPTTGPPPTNTPSPTPCPNLCTAGACGSFSVGACDYNCGSASTACTSTQYCNSSNHQCTNYVCNDSCPSNGDDCGGGLFCSGLAGNKCRNPSCGGATDCTCFGTCGNGVCDVGETYQTCSVDGCACTPDCSGKVCGDDGCGGSCGACGGGQSCAGNGSSCLAPTSAPTYTFTATPNPCTLSGGTCPPVSISWSTSGYSNVTVIRAGLQVDSGASGNYSDNNVTSGCIAYALRSNGSNISTMNVCGQDSNGTVWIKLKNGSFQSTSAMSNPVPTLAQAFDSDDSTSPYFIISSAGVTGAGIVVAPTVAVGSSNVSSNNWKVQGYTPTILFDKTKMLSYIKSRKTHTTITQLTQIDHDGIYLMTGDQTLSAIPSATYNVVLVVTGTITITSNITTTTPSFALIADHIIINDSVTEVDGLLVADTINTTSSGSSTSKLKIKGNMIAETLTNGRNQNANSNAVPSVFIVVDPTLYTNLLPFLSVSKYEWKQLQ